MPKKVVTRRQRKAAEAKRKAEEEARLNILASIGGQNAVEDAKASDEDAQNTTTHDEPSQQQSQGGPAVDAMGPPLTRHKIRGYFGKKKLKKLVRDYKRGMKSAKMGQRLAAEESRQQYSIEGPEQIPPVFKKLAETSTSHNVALEVLKTNWYDGQEVKPSLNDSLVTKICKQIKAQINTVLNKAKQGDRGPLELRPRSEQRPVARESCSDPGQGAGFVEVPDTLQTEEDSKDATTTTPEAPPIQPPKVFGNTGYFMLTGTDEQLAQQLADLAARNVVIQSYLHCPDPFMDRVEQQLNDLVANREELVEKMRSKHGMLASPRERRQMKSKKHMT